MNRSELEKLSKSELIKLYLKIGVNKSKTDHGIKKGDIIIEKKKLSGYSIPKIYEVVKFISEGVYLRSVHYGSKEFIKFTTYHNTDDDTDDDTRDIRIWQNEDILYKYEIFDENKFYQIF